MKWYSKYLQVYEQPFASAPPEVVGFVKKKLRKLSENKQPLASVVLICHNEETRLLSCLWSLCDNECDFPIEILAVNNNSTDRTEAVMKPRRAPDTPANADLIRLKESIISASILIRYILPAI